MQAAGTQHKQTSKCWVTTETNANWVATQTGTHKFLGNGTSKLLLGRRAAWAWGGGTNKHKLLDVDGEENHFSFH